MAFRRATLVLFCIAAALSAHPMGNFSVNHYSRLFFQAADARLTYVLDLAEIPTFELLDQWKINSKNQPQVLEKSKEQAKAWLDNLVLMNAGRRVALHMESISPEVVEGAGGMPILRVTMTIKASLKPGEITYEDRNFPGRAGWKEIVIDHDGGAVLRGASQGSKDVTAQLTTYPSDPGIIPPQDLIAHVAWTPVNRPVIAPVTEAVVDAAPAKPPVQAFSQQQPAAPGTVVRGDFLSRLIQNRELTWGMILAGILVAFGLGSMHALSPGHGKTIVAAYLVGSRGTWKHAAFLGLTVTFTHTLSVFLLGLGVLFFQQYIIPEQIIPVLGAISGLSIVGVGLFLLYQRSKALMAAGHTHTHHHHDHSHDHGHHHDHEHHHHDHEAGHAHTHAHTHGGHTHSHVPEGKVSLGSLIALGVSGGLVPCPSALILMLSAIALGHPGLGLVFLVGFSAGLALVLMGVGILVVYAKHLLPAGKSVMSRPLVKLVPVFSAVVVICLGLVVTAVSAGWVQPLRFLS